MFIYPLLTHDASGLPLIDTEDSAEHVLQQKSGFWSFKKAAGSGGQQQQFARSLWSFSSQPICVHRAKSTGTRKLGLQGRVQLAQGNSLFPMERQSERGLAVGFCSEVLCLKPAPLDSINL